MDDKIVMNIPDFADLVFEHIPLGVAVYDARDLRLLRANARFLSFLDPAWRGEWAIGHLYTEMFPNEAPPSAAIFRRVAETGIPYRVEGYASSAFERGLTYWNWALDPVRDQDGHVTHLLLTASEVTAQVLAQQHTERLLAQTTRLVEAEHQRLEVIETVARSVREFLDTESIGKAAIDAISAHFDPMRVCIHTADPIQQALHLVHIHTAPGAEQSVRVIQHVSYTSSFLMARAHQQRHPIIVEDLQDAVALRVIARDKPPFLPLGEHGYICIPLWFKDHFEGTLIAVFRDSIRPDGPEVQTLVGCSTHIAAALAHARLHAALEHQYTRLHAVVDQLPEGVFLVGASDERINYTNAMASSILGISATEVNRYPLHPPGALNVPTDLTGRPLPLEDRPADCALRGETISGKELMVAKPDGSKVVLLCSAAPVLTENGVITEAVVVFQDITERKSVEQQKNAFLSIASHELRTPIAAIQGFAELLQLYVSFGHSLDSPQGLQAVTRIIEQSHYLTRLIEEMLDLSRIESGLFSVHCAPHDVLATLTHVRESQAVTSKDHHLHLVVEGWSPTDPLIGYFDEERIEQVLSNLISNAIKYSPAGGEIELGLRRNPEAAHEVLLWVKDHGIGIPAEELPFIFTRFHRARNVDRTISGFGIGLYLVQEMVTRHGGRVWAESTEGSGSTFFVRLPLTHDHLQSADLEQETTICNNV